MSDKALNALKRATEGLLYMSESDEPFETFGWDKLEGPLTDQKVISLSGHKPGSNVETISLDEFFSDLTKEQDWYEKEEKEAARKYAKLREVIEKNLKDVRVYRVGEVNIDIYIVGKSEVGKWVGIKTKAVET